MRLTITMVDSADAKTTKSFDKLSDAVTDDMLKSLTKSYAGLTTSAVTTAKKVVTTELNLAD